MAASPTTKPSLVMLPLQLAFFQASGCSTLQQMILQALWAFCSLLMLYNLWEQRHRFSVQR